MGRIRSVLTLWFLFLLATACSDGGGTPFEIGGNGPILSGFEVLIDFEEFSPGDTVVGSKGVSISLLEHGPDCADALIAFDSGAPPGDNDDDLDLGTPNQAFGGSGVGRGGEKGPYRNDKPLGMILVIQEDPAYPDFNPDPQDDCHQGGTVAFDFTALAAGGVVADRITLIDVDEAETVESNEIRLYDPAGGLLLAIHPPFTRSNGVVVLDLGSTPGVARIEATVREALGFDGVSFVVPGS